MNRTRIVRWLRVLLPLTAIVILSTLFLFSRQQGAEPQIPYADVDAEQMARDPRLVAPEYAGVTDDGAELTLRATEASPGGDSGAGRASDLTLNWKRPDGMTADLVAPQVGVTDGVIGLDGGVRMTTSSGWSVQSPRIEAATDRSQITANDGVEAEAPFGTIRADTMQLAPQGTGQQVGDAAILNFSGSVRLIYQP